MSRIVGKITKGNITLTEYQYDNGAKSPAHYYLQCGIVGFMLTNDEMNDLVKVLNLLSVLDEYDDFTLNIGGEDVAI